MLTIECAAPSDAEKLAAFLQDGYIWARASHRVVDTKATKGEAKNAIETLALRGAVINGVG